MSTLDDVIWTLNGDGSVLEGNAASYTLSYSEAELTSEDFISVKIELVDITTNSSDYSSFIAALSDAAAATDGVSFDDGTQVVTFTGGEGTESSLTFNLPIKLDASVEGNESYEIMISDPSHGTIQTGLVSTAISEGVVWDLSGPGGIYEGEAPIYTLQYSGVTLGEGESISIDLSLHFPVSGGAQTSDFIDSFYQDIQDAIDDQGLGSSVSLTGSTLTFSGSSAPTSFEFSLPTVDDEVFEGYERFSVQISSPSPVGSIERNVVDTAISDDDKPTVWINDGTPYYPPDPIPPVPDPGPVTEQKGAQVIFRIELSNAADEDITVNWTTVNGPSGTGAVSGEDFGIEEKYDPVTGQATIPEGSTYVDVPINVLNDDIFEGDETFTMVISDAKYAGETLLPISDDTGEAKITDTPDQPTVSISDGVPSPATEEEGAKITFTISMTNEADEDVTVEWKTVDGTAIAGEDFVASGDTATIPAGDTSVEVEVPLMDNDTFEGLEDFTVVISNAEYTGDGTVLTITEDTGEASIIDTPDKPEVWINDGVPYPAEEGTHSQIVFRIEVSNAADENITVDWTTANGTAIAGEDFGTDKDPSQISGQAVIPAGSTFVEVPINVLDDSIFEGYDAELFTMVISNAKYAAGTLDEVVLLISENKDTGDAAIVDNELEPTLLGEIVVNEIGFGIGESLAKQGSTVSIVSTDQNYIEIRNIGDHGIGASVLRSLSIEIIGEDGTTIQVIDLSQANGLSSLEAKGFLTIYEDGSWVVSKPNIDPEDPYGNIRSAGNFDTPGSTFPYDWGFGTNTTYPVAVNLVQTDPKTDSIGSVDLFIANGVDKTLLTGGSTAWRGEPFNGELGEHLVFARVFADSHSGKDAPPGDFYPLGHPEHPYKIPIDTNEALDWTTSNAATERAYNAYPGDYNPLDSTDDLDPAQAAGTNLPDAGQTVATAGRMGEGNDLTGGRGPDVLTGNEEKNVLDGGDHNDLLDGKAGDDQLYGGKGGDRLIGGEGDDTLDGGSGEDTIIGGPGDDTIIDSDGDGTVDGGGGIDTFKFTAGGGDATDLDLSTSDIDISGVEIFDMTDSDNLDKLTLTKADVLALGDSNNAGDIVVDADPGGHAPNVDIYINGDAGDTVELQTTGWGFDNTITIGPDIYDVYINGTAIIAIHQNISVDIIP